jgi:hypothetical protein
MVVWAGALAFSACAHGAGSVAFDASAVHAEGLGGYTTELLPGEKGPSNRKGAAVKPKVTERFKGTPSTNDWWSSLIWQFDGDAHSKAMFPHPLAMKADAGGLSIGYPSEPKVGSREYRYPYSRDLHISLSGLDAPDTRVESWSDWAVTASWSDPDHAVRGRFGHGLRLV